LHNIESHSTMSSEASSHDFVVISAEFSYSTAIDDDEFVLMDNANE
jgi:hypothetical protein